MEIAIIESLATSLLQDKSIINMLQSANITKEELKAELTRQLRKNKQHAYTLDCYKEMTLENYDDGWNEDCSHCIFYHVGRSCTANGYIHKHCGVRTNNRIICVSCIRLEKAKKVLEKINEGLLSLQDYRDECKAQRLLFVRSKFKQFSTPYLYLQVKKDNARHLLEEYKHAVELEHEAPKHLMYLRNNGLVVNREIIKGELKYTTVGIDKKNNGVIKKLTLADMEALKGIPLCFNVSSIDPSALKLIDWKQQVKR